MTPHLQENLTRLFTLLAKAAARKKIYAQKANRDGRPDLAHLLRAISASEAVQRHRLFKTMRGQIDTSDRYLATIFEKEIPFLLDEYSQGIQAAREADNTAMIHALSQLRAALFQLQSFYSPDKKDLRQEREAPYFLCQFCGYLSVHHPPDTCPVCGAKKEDFQEIF
jgi:rubrerythrin